MLVVWLAFLIEFAINLRKNTKEYRFSSAVGCLSLAMNASERDYSVVKLVNMLINCGNSSKSLTAIVFCTMVLVSSGLDSFCAITSIEVPLKLYSSRIKYSIATSLPSCESYSSYSRKRSLHASRVWDS